MCIYIWAASETDKIARLLKSDIRRLSVYLIHQLLKYVYIIKKLLQNIISNFRGAKARFHAILLSFLVKALLLKKTFICLQSILLWMVVYVKLLPNIEQWVRYTWQVMQVCYNSTHLWWIYHVNLRLSRKLRKLIQLEKHYDSQLQNI